MKSKSVQKECESDTGLKVKEFKENEMNYNYFDLFPGIRESIPTPRLFKKLIFKAKTFLYL